MTSMTYSETGLDSIPVGYRFRPTDEELVTYYLRLKIQGDKDFEVRAIREVNIYKYEPWDLPRESVIQSDDPEWFFFCAREIKYSNRNRLNRMTEKGFWKITGNKRNIKVRGTNNVIGTKQTMVFHQGRVRNGVRTHWVIHEYQLATFPPHQQAFVLCRLFKKPDVRTNEAPCDDGDVSRDAASDFEGQVPGHTIPEIHEFNQVDAGLASVHQHQRQDYDIASSLQLDEYNQQEPPVPYPTLTGDFDFDESRYAASDFEGQVPGHTIPEIHEFYQVDAGLATVHQHQRQDYDIASSLQLEEYNQQEPPVLDSTLTDDFDIDTDQFVNSFLNPPNEQDEYTFEEVRQSNNSRAPDSPITIYYGGGGLSSDSDTDTAQAQHQQMHIINGGTASSSNRGQYKEKRNGVVLDASSVDSAADIRHVLSTQSRSRHSVEQRAAPRKFHLKNSSLKVVSIDKAEDASRLSIITNLPQKERSITESDKEQKMAQGTNADNSPKLKKVRSAGSDQKGSLIFQETSQKGHESSPPLVYFFKILLGIFLFVVFFREMLLYGNWC